MDRKEVLEYAECLGLTEKDVDEGVAHYLKTGQVLNRAVALMVGLTED